MKNIQMPYSIKLFFLISLVCAISPSAYAQSSASVAKQLDDFWHGQAHFQEINRLNWETSPDDKSREGEGTFARPIFDGKWYVFNRKMISDRPGYCPTPSWSIVVRSSSDQGRTWSDPPVVVAHPGPDWAADACTIVDGSVYFDQDSETWHLLAQCLAAHNAGGWSLCHYSRQGRSPLGPFVADNRPATTAGELWSQICKGTSRGSCDPSHTIDEGTPDIVKKDGGYFYVTFHGFNPRSKEGFRGIAKTKDFHRWYVSDRDLPDDAMLTPQECKAWNPGCIGGGEATTLLTSDYEYMLIETPDESLGCMEGQNWPVVLLRAPSTSFPIWSSPLWQKFPGNPVLTTSAPGPRSMCGIQYPRWIVDSDNVYLVYEDFIWREHGPRKNIRYLLKLVPGGGPPVILTKSATGK